MDLIYESGIRIRNRWCSQLVPQKIKSFQAPQISSSWYHRRRPIVCQRSESTPTNETQIKVLGNIWDTETDMLLFNFEELIEYAQSLSMTKRSFLKWSSKIFDPLGLLTPFTIKLKIKFQELCLAKITWDEKADEKLCVTMNNLISELAFLNKVPVPRCYFLTNLKPAVAQIHGFSDASERAFAAAVYLRTVYVRW